MRQRWLLLAYALPVGTAVGVLLHDEWKRTHRHIRVITPAP